MALGVLLLLLFGVLTRDHDEIQHGSIISDF